MFVNLLRPLTFAIVVKICGKDFNIAILDKIHYYQAVRSILFKLIKGDAPDIDTMNAHVMKMMQDAIKSEGIEEVFSSETDIDAETVDLFSDEVLQSINRIKLPNTKIKLLTQLLKKTLQDFKKDNRIKALIFEERLQVIIDDYNSRMTDKEYVEEVLNDVADQMIELLRKLNEEKHSFEEMGIDYEEKSFFDILLTVADKYNFTFPTEKNIELAKAIHEKIKDRLIIGFLCICLAVRIFH